eukprot:111306-Chlamydomonas_euryale.AAC.1
MVRRGGLAPVLRRDYACSAGHAVYTSRHLAQRRLADYLAATSSTTAAAAAAASPLLDVRAAVS